MVEWSITAVLKTVEMRVSGGSNPSLRAIKCGQKRSMRLDLRNFLGFLHYYLQNCNGYFYGCKMAALRYWSDSNRRLRKLNRIERKNKSIVLTKTVGFFIAYPIRVYKKCDTVRFTNEENCGRM